MARFLASSSLYPSPSPFSVTHLPQNRAISWIRVVVVAVGMSSVCQIRRKWNCTGDEVGIVYLIQMAEVGNSWACGLTISYSGIVTFIWNLDTNVHGTQILRCSFFQPLTSREGSSVFSIFVKKNSQFSWILQLVYKLVNKLVETLDNDRVVWTSRNVE